MGLPKYYELYRPFLKALSDEKVHTLKEIKDYITKLLNLNEELLLERLPSGKQTIYDNRIGWARTYLKKAGLISSPQRAHLQITVEGQALLASGVNITDRLLAERYSEFADFIIGGKKIAKQKDNIEETALETPQETLERVFKNINKQLADDLLTEIMNQSATFLKT